MDLYVLRHGQTDYNLEGKFQGQVDIEMNETGKKQVKKTAEQLKQIKFNKVFVSPLQRTKDTAQIVTNEKMILEPRIIERSFGTLEGKYGISDYEEKIQEFNIEPILKVEERVKSFLEEILKKSKKEENILIVTHEGIAQIINIILNKEISKKEMKNFRLGTAQYVKYKI